MRIELKGNMGNDTELMGALEDLLDTWCDKLKEENPEMFGALDTELEDVRYISATFDLQFKMKGSDEWQVITTDNHAAVPELLVVRGTVDDDGNLAEDSVEDNDENSDFTELEAMIAAGIKKDFEEITTKHDIDSYPENYKVISVFDLGSHYVHISQSIESSELIVHAYSGEGAKLIAEAVFPEEQLDALVAHYADLEDAVIYAAE